MMASDRVAAPGAVRGWPPHDIGQRPVGLDEIKIGRRDVRQIVSQIAHQRYALQENFGQSHCRSDIQIDPAAIHSSHQFRQQAKIRMRRRPQRAAVSGRMKMSNVAADRNERGEWQARFVGCAQQR